jgi:hypothetical protein
LDDQITETRHVRERINAVIHREYDAPYFPERRDITNPTYRIAAPTSTGLQSPLI